MICDLFSSLMKSLMRAFAFVVKTMRNQSSDGFCLEEVNISI